MSKYRKKPIVIEAFKWTGGPDQTEDPEWIVEALKKGDVYIINSGTKKVKLMIKTLEGLMMTRPGDYIIKGIKGEIYPCKPDIFESSYDEVVE
jgi:hypothetical protein